MNILVVNLVFTAAVFWIAARIYIIPRLSELRPQDVLVPILLLHAMRNLGLMFLSRGAVYPGIPSDFAYPAAIGDLVAAILALLSLAALLKGAAIARPLLWIFSIEGSLDLIAAITLATIHSADKLMGPAYWIPAFWVPALLVTHVIVFMILWRHGAKLTQ